MFKPSIMPERFNLSPQNSWVLLVCQFLNLILLVNELSGWMIAIISLCLCWRVSMLINPSLKPQRLILILLACSGCLAIALNSQQLGVLLSMLHLLCFAYSLKSLELNTRNDFYQINLLGIFILASVLIFYQSLLISFVVFCLLVLNLTILLGHFSGQKNIKSLLKQSGKIVIQSLPLALVLFVIFPRLSPFWQVPSAKSAQTGLSENVTPGDVAKLARSSELAFRATFFTDIPAYNQLYWRAMVMDNFDGKTWSQSKSNRINNHNKVDPFAITLPNLIGKKTQYQVIAEPSYQEWLFSLAVVDPKSVKDSQVNIFSLPNYTIKSSKPISQTTSYQVTSYTETTLEPLLNDKDRFINLRIPIDSNPKLQAQGRELSFKYSDEIQRAQALLNIIREQEFYYTLTPPLLTGNELDQFFYQTKKGFCVHYASVFTFIMRASGIPARLVTGYLGGEYNNTNRSGNSAQIKQGGHLSIYQYDAHAWAEIWLEGVGWYRVDPTAAVDPQRVDSGWSTALLNQQSSLNNDLLGLYQFKKIAWLNKLRLQLDALDYQWTRWVLGYSSKQQYNILKQLFGDNAQWKIVITIVSMLIGVMMLFTLMYRFNFSFLKCKKIAPWLRLYQKTLKKLAKKGLSRPFDMTPTSFARAVANECPELSIKFFEFTELFELLMYQELSDSEQSECLSRMECQYKSLKKIIFNL